MVQMIVVSLLRQPAKMGSMIATTNDERLAASVDEDAEACKVLTNWHSTRSIDEFVQLAFSARRDSAGRRP
jgi:hypothetical protein